MLHETAVSWLRARLAKTLPRASWDETVEQYHQRLKSCAAYINSNYDVPSLCLGFPGRLQELERRRRDRLCQ